MRLRQALSFLLVAAVSIAVLSMGALMAWNLRDGFSKYLESRETERLDQFAALVSEKAEQAGGIEGLEERHLHMAVLLHEFAVREGVDPRTLPPPDGEVPPREGDGTSPAPKGMGGGHERERRPRGPGSDGFGKRVALYDLQGEAVLGAPLPLSNRPYVQRPVHALGKLIAWARLLPATPLPNVVEASFLRTQYVRIASVASGLVLLALISAWWVARKWSRPLIAIQEATSRVARGELDVRLSESRKDEIGDVMRNVNRMADGLQRLEGARRRWIADMSHELRTPLTILRGEIDAVADGVRALRPEIIHSLREEVLRLGALIDDLHDLAMSDLSALPCHFAPCNVEMIVRDVVQRFQLRAHRQGLELTLRVRPAQSAAFNVFWDPKRIDQLLVNLLDNSLRYSDPPGEIDLELEALGERILLRIDDSEPGVPIEDLERLFEPLYRADSARSRNSGGSGLGLAICEAIVLAHGGRIRAERSSLGGLSVRLEIPREMGDA